MSRLRIALLQLLPAAADQPANLAIGEASCRRARQLGADLALFPEMWNIGYTAYPGSPTDLDQVRVESAEQRVARLAWQAAAITADDTFVTHFRGVARELEMAIALTYLERWPGAPRNVVSVIDRTGAIILHYAKVHTCDFGLEAACTPGGEFHVAPLITADGSVMIGAMICCDREFPETARMLMLKGVEIILVPNACEMELNRLSQLRARAFENMVGIALANYPAPHQNGHSVAYDGIAFDRDGGSREMTLTEMGEEAGISVVTFDVEALRDYRRGEVWGNAFRRPHRYGLLSATSVASPFDRTNGVGERYEPTRR